MSKAPPWNNTQPAQMAFIREDECIGCTKCLPDCPTDAILGAPKFMHTVLTSACTGCELCVPACPVDCIEIRPLAPRTEAQKQQLSHEWQTRFDKHNQRQDENTAEKEAQYHKDKFSDEADSLAERKKYIAEALARIKNKRPRN